MRNGKKVVSLQRIPKPKTDYQATRYEEDRLNVSVADAQPDAGRSADSWQQHHSERGSRPSGLDLRGRPDGRVPHQRHPFGYAVGQCHHRLRGRSRDVPRGEKAGRSAEGRHADVEGQDDEARLLPRRREGPRRGQGVQGGLCRSLLARASAAHDGHAHRLQRLLATGRQGGAPGRPEPHAEAAARALHQGRQRLRGVVPEHEVELPHLRHPVRAREGGALSRPAAGAGSRRAPLRRRRVDGLAGCRHA